MFDIALGIFLFLSPIFFLLKPIGNVNALKFYQFGVLGNSGYNYLQLLFFLFAVVGLFIVALLSKPQREFKDKWAVVLLSLFCLNVYLHPIGIRFITPIFLGFLLYYLVVVYTKDYTKLFKFILCAVSLNTIFAILQFFNINLIYASTGRCDGLMALSTHLGAYLVIALPICYTINPFLAIIPIIGILLSKSITAIFIMLCWLILGVFNPIKLKGKKFYLCSTPFLLSVLSLITGFIIYNWVAIINKFSVRILVWKPAIKGILNHPILGNGLKPFTFLSPIGLYENPCSIYLEVIYYLGILSIIPIFYMFLNLLLGRNKIVLLSILIALFVGIEKSIFDFPRLAGTIIVLLALLNVTKESEAV